MQPLQLRNPDPALLADTSLLDEASGGQAGECLSTNGQPRPPAARDITKVCVHSASAKRQRTGTGPVGVAHTLGQRNAVASEAGLLTGANS